MMDMSKMLFKGQVCDENVKAMIFAFALINKKNEEAKIQWEINKSIASSESYHFESFFQQFALLNIGNSRL